jgi:hypothetical protein
MKKLVVAWDLDFTLIDSSHRIKLKENGDIDLEDWYKTSNDKEMVFKDILLPLSELFYEFQKTGFTQICVTARKMTQTDFDYLKSNGLKFDAVLHRANSLELDEVLKNKKLKEFLEKEGRIPFMAFDDKNENLEVFDKYGFRTFNAIYMNEKLKKSSYEDILKISPSDFK